MLVADTGDALEAVLEPDMTFDEDRDEPARHEREIRDHVLFNYAMSSPRDSRCRRRSREWPHVVLGQQRDPLRMHELGRQPSTSFHRGNLVIEVAFGFITNDTG